MRRLMLVYGTRPEAIKLAPITAGLLADPSFEPIVVITGQHTEMVDQVHELFQLTPDVDLALHTPGQTLAEVTSRALTGVASAIVAYRPAAVVVQGDTTSTFSAALAAFYERVPVVHVEAGLRTSDRYAPFPEEINRRMTTDLAELHLAPTSVAAANLAAEGIPGDRIVVTGNPVIDALFAVAGRRLPYADPRLSDLVASGRRILLVTTHRRESWGEPMRRAMAAVAALADADPDLAVVLPMHANPEVRATVHDALDGRSNVLLIPPLPYGEFARLLADATVVLTDSGGVQEEAPSLGTPVLVLRDSTERVEALDAGTIALVGTDPDRIIGATRRLLDDDAAYAAMVEAGRNANPYGDGKAAGRCIAAIDALLADR